MYRKLLFTICLALVSSAAVAAEDQGATAPKATASTGATAPVASTASTAAAPAAAAPQAAAAAPAPAAGEPAAADSADPAAKAMRGMAVLGNNEAPMSLFIVPWKSSELGVEANVHRTLNERDAPVDREVFMREVEYYQVSVGGKTPTLAEVYQGLKTN